MIVWTNLDSALFCVAMGMKDTVRQTVNLREASGSFFKKKKTKLTTSSFATVSLESAS